MIEMSEDDAESLKPSVRKTMLDLLNQQIQPYLDQIRVLEKTCQHQVKALTETPEEYYKKDRWRSDVAICEGCDRDMGWYCPKSPNHICDYGNDENDNFDPDCCIHCHMPDERK